MSELEALIHGAAPEVIVSRDLRPRVLDQARWRTRQEHASHGLMPLFLAISMLVTLGTSTLCPMGEGLARQVAELDLARRELTSGVNRSPIEDPRTGLRSYVVRPVRSTTSMPTTEWELVDGYLRFQARQRDLFFGRPRGAL
ncbi:MAG TPA: hypothetical protein VIY86_15040 [Pirellulaceae bacterium]